LEEGGEPPDIRLGWINIEEATGTSYTSRNILFLPALPDKDKRGLGVVSGYRCGWQLLKS
jgi:hypothetical protein